ncbi:amidohydrolase family protein [Leucobacter ruminantium]|uniref:Amidohydrolase family protein n=1 Tax=Leucobacter ruminantium TaxID=1289170 RepID=A0A939RU10_9MICO|nr:amidohydrolase family protein [Leucobacter ruminantium]
MIVGERIHPVAAAPGRGFVATVGGRIVAVDTEGGSPSDLIGPRTEVVDAGVGTVVPGLHDNHTFFTSQLLEHGGLDAAALGEDELEAAGRAARDAGEPLFLRGVDPERAPRLIERLEVAAPGVDAIVLARGRTALECSPAAARRLGAPDPSSNEALHGVYAQLAAQPATVRAAFAAASAAMHRGGVTSVKDIAFDAHLGMLAEVDRMLGEGSLAVRYAFASQPVAAPADLRAAEEWRAEGRTGIGRCDPARFHGFKLMSDGSFDEGTADLLPPDDEWRRRQRPDVDYAALRAEAARVLDADFALALNADGDGAVRACVEIFAGRERIPAGSSISDVSMVANAEAEAIAELGLAVETYPQMLRFEGYSGAFLDGLLGPRAPHLCNLAEMLHRGVTVSAGTDFPLFAPSLPEAMLSASERILGAGVPIERWRPERAVSRAAVLEMWTAAGAVAMGAVERWGVLVPGAAADVAVFDRDLFEAEPASLAEASVRLVIAGGAVVFAS